MTEFKPVDPITIEVIRNSLEASVEEMGMTVSRLAHSIIFAENKDFSVALFTRDAELLALAQYVPAHQGGMATNLAAVLETIGEHNLFPGDVVMQNDPYSGGLHAQDMAYLAPIFYEDQLIAYAGTVAHRTDVGGMAPGSYCPGASEVYQEAIRFPCIKLVERGKLREDIMRIHLTNVRLPEDQMADTQAQLAALRGCESSVKRLVDKYGVNTFLSAAKEILDISERRARAEVERIPDGKYTYFDYTEHDGFSDRDWKLQVTVEIKGSDIYVDFAGTDEQAKGFINAAPFLTISQAWMALMFWVDPAIPKNQGLYRPFKSISAPKGTILNPNFPAPVGGCTCDSGGLVLDIMLGALTQASPDRGLACWTHASVGPTFYGTDPDTGRMFILSILDGLATGGGARSYADGWPVARVTSSTIGIPNAEIIEQHFPLRYTKREMVTDAGGDGEFRGGPGIEVEYEVLAPMQMTVMGLRRRHPCPGAAGGTAGGPHMMYLVSGGEERLLPLKAEGVQLSKGDKVRFTTPGGGGYGSVEKRDPEKTMNDVLDGYLSAEKAMEVYGLTTACESLA